MFALGLVTGFVICGALLVVACWLSARLAPEAPWQPVRVPSACSVCGEAACHRDIDNDPYCQACWDEHIEYFFKWACKQEDER